MQKNQGLKRASHQNLKVFEIFKAIFSVASEVNIQRENVEDVLNVFHRYILLSKNSRGN